MNRCRSLNSPLSVVSVNQRRPHVQTVHNVHVKGFSETTKTTTIDLANKFLKPLTQPISHEKTTISQKTPNQWEEISIVSEPTWGEGYSEQWRRGWSFTITSVKLGSKCIHIYIYCIYWIHCLYIIGKQPTLGTKIKPCWRVGEMPDLHKNISTQLKDYCICLDSKINHVNSPMKDRYFTHFTWTRKVLSCMRTCTCMR